jgi:hypothetical protein
MRAVGARNICSPVTFKSLAEHTDAMGATMPFSRYKTADSDLMEAMRAAFHRICDVLQLACDREDPLTEVVVTKIVELAKTGERDPEKLCFAVLAAFVAQAGVHRLDRGGLCLASLRGAARLTDDRLPDERGGGARHLIGRSLSRKATFWWSPASIASPGALGTFKTSFALSEHGARS